jgi:hypothetical protein
LAKVPTVSALGEKFPGLEDTRVEVEFAGPVSRPVGGG